MIQLEDESDESEEELSPGPSFKTSPESADRKSETNFFKAANMVGANSSG